MSSCDRLESVLRSRNPAAGPPTLARCLPGCSPLVGVLLLTQHRRFSWDQQGWRGAHPLHFGCAAATSPTVGHSVALAKLFTMKCALLVGLSRELYMDSYVPVELQASSSTIYMWASEPP